MTKLSRQNTILELVQQETVENQEQLRRLLSKRGCVVTQATLSRDIRELGLVKTSEGYSLAPGEAASELMVPAALRLVKNFVVEIRQAHNLLVIKTATGSAQPVAAAIDAEGWPEIVGTVGGDDTILIISQNRRNAHRVALRVRSMQA
jgi:transcriptional regulator of arginine metabolism